MELFNATHWSWTIFVRYSSTIYLSHMDCVSNIANFFSSPTFISIYPISFQSFLWNIAQWRILLVFFSGHPISIVALGPLTRIWLSVMPYYVQAWAFCWIVGTNFSLLHHNGARWVLFFTGSGRILPMSSPCLTPARLHVKQFCQGKHQAVEVWRQTIVVWRSHGPIMIGCAVVCTQGAYGWWLVSRQWSEYCVCRSIIQFLTLSATFAKGSSVEGIDAFIHGVPNLACLNSPFLWVCTLLWFISEIYSEIGLPSGIGLVSHIRSDRFASKNTYEHTCYNDVPRLLTAVR